jgi:hypothetical protein
MASVDMNHSLSGKKEGYKNIRQFGKPHRLFLFTFREYELFLITGMSYIFHIIRYTKREREYCVTLRMFPVIMIYVGVLQIKNVSGHLADGH